MIAMIGSAMMTGNVAMASAVAARVDAVAVSARRYRSSTGDPLGPIDGNPDGPRDLACELTAAETVCTPEVADPVDPSDFPSTSGGGFGGFVGTLLVVLLVAALVGVLAWIVVSMLKNRAAVVDDEIDELDEALDGDAEQRIVDVERPPDRWRRVAAEHRAAGSFRDAVRCEYRALVGDLARAGHVDEIPGRTSGEEREQLRTLAPQVAPTFDEAADIFDAAWFDDSPVTADDDRQFVAASTAVLDQVLSPSATRRDSR